VEGGSVCVRRGGSGPAVLLLHGFPETSWAWRKIAPDLADSFTVVAADLPGYGESVLDDNAFVDGRLAKRAMARALVDAMSTLDLQRFVVVGHDRGARVAHRMALDHPDRVIGLAVLDVVPILDMAERLTYDAAREMGHWFWLAQPSTFPETLIGRDPAGYVRHIVEAWGGAGVVDSDAIDRYASAMRTPAVLRAMGAEYRADLLDLEHDRADRRAARRIACPVLAVWAQGGLTERFGDPLAIWRLWADRVSGGALPGGHFMMEESPRQLLDLLDPFLAEVCRSSVR
jgi:haloacetate dehalogenase